MKIVVNSSRHSQHTRFHPMPHLFQCHHQQQQQQIPSHNHRLLHHFLLLVHVARRKVPLLPRMLLVLRALDDLGLLRPR